MANMSTHRTFTWIVVGSLFLSSRPQVCKDLDSSLPTACEIADTLELLLLSANSDSRILSQHQFIVLQNVSCSRYLLIDFATFLLPLQSFFFALAPINVFSGLARLGDPSVPYSVSKFWRVWMLQPTTDYDDYK